MQFPSKSVIFKSILSWNTESIGISSHISIPTDMGTNPNGFDPVEDWKHFIHPIKGILSQKCILQDSSVGQQQSFHRCNFIHINIYKYK